jgi:hypothetical protein
MRSSRHISFRIIKPREKMPSKVQSEERPVAGRVGDKLIIDRKGPDRSIRMRMTLAPSVTGDGDPFRGLVSPPVLPQPVTLREEVRARRAVYPIDEIVDRVLGYLTARYGDCFEVNESELRTRLEEYVKSTSISSWNQIGDLGDLGDLGDEFVNCLL